jgi:hypothetical protein
MIFQIIFFAVWLIRSPFAITANSGSYTQGRIAGDFLSS